MCRTFQYTLLLYTHDMQIEREREPGRWLCQLAQQPGARLPRRQDLPAEAVWDTGWNRGQIKEISKFVGESRGYDAHTYIYI